MARTIVAGPMSQSGTVLEPGSRVGDSYEVVRLIGRGGMGEVWLARHLRLASKQVAVKVLHTRGEALSPEALARFKREADVATRINHPNIVEVHDYNTLPTGSPYLVLEYLQGESLASRIRFGALTLEEASQVVRQVGSALDKSHALGVVHRDLKPDNIFLVSTAVGMHVKVLDFGISKVVDSTTLQTADEVLVGTPQYMSPEQAIGANKDVGPQTDVFAFGSIVYEMLSGVPAFAADSVAKLVFRIAYEKHKPLEQVKPGLPARVYAAVERALEKDRSKRCADVAAFVAEFTGQPLTRNQPVPAAPAPEGPGGVAAPGMATPDSLALGATAARTPAPALSPPPPQPPSAPQQLATPVPTPRRSPVLIIAALGVLVAGAGAFVMLRPPPAVPPPPLPLGVAPPPVEKVPVPAIADAAVAVVEVVDAGAPAPTVKAPPVRKPLPREDAEIIRDMESKMMAKDGYERCIQRMKDLNSGEGVSRGYAVLTKVACKDRSLSSAKGQFAKIAERADMRDAAVFCRKYGIELE
jgi:serine/threonine-protein kinase